MEIHLLLEGERVGPLSVEQVRQYLDNGLVSPTDLATYEGMEDWLPLDLVLSHLPPFVPTPETVSSPEPPAAASPPPTHVPLETADPSFIMQNETFEPFELTSESPPEEPTPSLTASQKTKRKLSKIVLQPILPLETTLPTKRKPKTGKTALTLEPLRPTTSLPPVTGHLPLARERKTGKVALRTGPVSLREFPESSSTAPAPSSELAAASSAPVEVRASQKLPPPRSQLSALPEGSEVFAPPPVSSVSTSPRGMRPGMLYAGIALAVLLIAILIGCIYLLTAHDQTPAATTTPSVSETAAPAPSQNAIQSPPVDPTTVAEFSKRGQKRQSKGDLDGAIADYTQALGLDPKAVEVYYQRGLARQATGDMAGAKADYTQVIALNPQRANAYSNRAFVKQAQHDVDGALADYNQALLLDPKIPVAFYNVGLIKVQKGDLDGAIAAYDRAIQLDPGMAFAYYNRGVAKNTEGNVDGAIADYTQAVGYNPKIALAFCDRGVARQSKGDVDGAMADYTQALALNPTMADAFYNRGLIKAQKGDLDGAVADNTQAIVLNDKYAQAYNKRGLALLGKGRLDDALADLKKFCDLVPRDAGTDSARLFIWVISTQQNANGDADATLSTSLLNDWNSPPEDLTSKIAAFLLGHINEGDLIANAASPDPSREPGQYCRVWYFAGMKRLFGGDAPTATSYFQKSVATQQKDFCEYTLSQMELQTLSKSSEVAVKPDAGT